MKKKRYWSSRTPAEKQGLAKRARTTVNYLSQVFNGHKPASTNLSKRLHKYSDYVVPLKEFRPDVWD